MKNICVFCSASDVGQQYVDSTKELGSLMVKNNFNLIWGGSDKGLMKVIADSVQNHGGKIYWITMEFLKDHRRLNADGMTIAKDLNERKKLLLAKSDAIILPVGGVGSLDEITEILEFKKHNLHQKPIVVLNTDDFYLGLKNQFERMDKEGFLPRRLDELIYFANLPSEAISYIKKSFDSSS